MTWETNNIQSPDEHYEKHMKTSSIRVSLWLTGYCVIAYIGMLLLNKQFFYSATQSWLQNWVPEGGRAQFRRINMKRQFFFLLRCLTPIYQTVISQCFDKSIYFRMFEYSWLLKGIVWSDATRHQSFVTRSTSLGLTKARSLKFDFVAKMGRNQSLFFRILIRNRKKVLFVMHTHTLIILLIVSTHISIGPQDKFIW